MLLPAPEGLPTFYPSNLVPIKAGAEAKPDTSSVIVFSPSMFQVVRRKDAVIEVDRSQEFDHDAVLSSRNRSGIARHRTP